MQKIVFGALVWEGILIAPDGIFGAAGTVNLLCIGSDLPASFAK